jgi:predicted hotdog family 3-hydroxylacyl-ACP dehydratase
MLNRDRIAALVPHSGAMVLLDRVVAWDAAAIRCSATSHRDPANPLREGAALPVWAGIEYAAQAAAVHGALVREGQAPRSGVLARLRDVRAGAQRLDDVAGDLDLEARLEHGDPRGAVYSFAVRGGDRVLLDGRFTLVFTAAA